MKKTAVNTFTEGLITDLNPLTTPQTILTDCKNGTLLTFNGNEMMLQNDMGNTTLLDESGNDVQLKEGYFPIGVKEYGGIMYIVSTNNINTEIGSFPGPKFSELDEVDKSIAETKIIEETIPEGSEQNISQLGKIIPLTDFDLKPGDYFLISLPFSEGEEALTNLNDDDVKRFYKISLININTGRDITSYFNKQKFLTNSKVIEETNNNWFLTKVLDSETNFQDYINSGISQIFPNALGVGKLGYKIELENINYFNLSEQFYGNMPILISPNSTNDYKYTSDYGTDQKITLTNPEDDKWRLYFPSFDIRQNSSFKVNEILISYTLTPLNGGQVITKNDIIITSSDSKGEDIIINMNDISVIRPTYFIDVLNDKDYIIEYTITPRNNHYDRNYSDNIIKYKINLSQDPAIWQSTPQLKKLADNTIGILNKYTHKIDGDGSSEYEALLTKVDWPGGFNPIASYSTNPGVAFTDKFSIKSKNIFSYQKNDIVNKIENVEFLSKTKKNNIKFTLTGKFHNKLKNYFNDKNATELTLDFGVEIGGYDPKLSGTYTEASNMSSVEKFTINEYDVKKRVVIGKTQSNGLSFGRGEANFTLDGFSEYPGKDGWTRPFRDVIANVNRDARPFVDTAELNGTYRSLSFDYNLVNKELDKATDSLYCTPFNNFDFSNINADRTSATDIYGLFSLGNQYRNTYFHNFNNLSCKVLINNTTGWQVEPIIATYVKFEGIEELATYVDLKYKQVQINPNEKAAFNGNRFYHNAGNSLSISKSSFPKNDDQNYIMGAFKGGSVNGGYQNSYGMHLQIDEAYILENQWYTIKYYVKSSTNSKLKINIIGGDLPQQLEEQSFDTSKDWVVKTYSFQGKSPGANTALYIYFYSERPDNFYVANVTLQRKLVSDDSIEYSPDVYVYEEYQNILQDNLGNVKERNEGIFLPSYPCNIIGTFRLDKNGKLSTTGKVTLNTIDGKTIETNINEKSIIY